MTDITDRIAALDGAMPAHVRAQILVDSGTADAFVRIDGPVGPMFVAFNDRGVSAIDLGEDPDRFVAWFGEFSGRELFPAAAMPDRLAGKLERALESGKVGALPIDWSTMSEFQQAVLRKITEIPPGEVRPYSWVAREIGRPKAARAVGTALAKNPVPVVVPCHRVVRNDGSLGNYAYGTPVKRRILQHEGMPVDATDALVEQGVRLTGSDTTKIFCFPSCGHARRTMLSHTVEFRSEDQAREAGYRPCRVCRPAA